MARAFSSRRRRPHTPCCLIKRLDRLKPAFSSAVSLIVRSSVSRVRGAMTAVRGSLAAFSVTSTGETPPGPFKVSAQCPLPSLAERIM